MEEGGRRAQGAMSFETEFEEWLRMESGDAERGEEDKHRQGEEEGASEEEEDRVEEEEEMPVIQREVWREEDIEDMPVLQKMVDLPPGGEDRKLGSPPPPSLQITHSLTDGFKTERQTKHRCKHQVTDQGLKAAAGGGKDDDADGYPLLQRGPQLLEGKLPAPKAQGKEPGEGISKLTCQNVQESAGKEKALLPCQAKSALTELTHLNQVDSPIAARGPEVDVVRSPEFDLPMEPDSTSEFLTACNRLLRARKGSEASRGEASPWGEVSPCNMGCMGLRTPNRNSIEVLARIEESAAECDSTSMFMNSPSAISPASQGEIEERVYPVLADHEDSASPSHFVCRCRSLPPSAELMSKERSPAVSTSSQLTVSSISHSVSCPSKSKPWTPLVSRACSVDDDQAPDLEKMAPSLDLMTTPSEGQRSDHDSPPVLTLPEQEALLKQLTTEHSQDKDIPVEGVQQEAPPLIRYGPEPPEASRGSRPSPCTKYSDSPPVLSSNDFHSQEKCRDSPPVLSLHKQEESCKPSKSKRRNEVCDFTSNIDWETAVVETVSPPDLSKYDGEYKPGIIIKIRTKGRTEAPSAQPTAKPQSVPKTAKKKRHMVDNTEILSRLRKRHKSGEEDQAVADSVEQQACPAAGSSAVNSQHKVSKKSVVHHLSGSSGKPKEKRLRRSTVSLRGDTAAVPTQGLSLPDSSFVRVSMELSRLQTLTRELLCVLFPRLQPHMVGLAPESGAFVGLIDDIILSLERSTSEESVLDCASLNSMFQTLSLEPADVVPVFSPRVVLCSSPGHVLEDFTSKICSLFQLLLPDLTVSLTQSLSHSSDKLAMFIRKVIAANKAKLAK